MGGVSSLGALLNRLQLEHYAAPFEDEAIEDVALLKSMGRQGLYDNLCGEMGLDAAGVATLSSALFDEADASEDELTLEPNDDDDDEHELLLEENEPQPPSTAAAPAATSAAAAAGATTAAAAAATTAAATAATTAATTAVATAAAAKYKAQGNAALEGGMLSEAVELYTQAIRLDPSDVVFFSNRSAALTKLRRFAEALSDAEAAVALRPAWAKGHARCGAALSGLDEHARAARAYARALELLPGDAHLQAMRDAALAAAAAAAPAAAATAAAAAAHAAASDELEGGEGPREDWVAALNEVVPQRPFIERAEAEPQRALALLAEYARQASTQHAHTARTHARTHSS